MDQFQWIQFTLSSLSAATISVEPPHTVNELLPIYLNSTHWKFGDLDYVGQN